MQAPDVDDHFRRSVLESLEEAYYEIDLTGRLLRCNSALCHLLGYAESELIGRINRQFQTREAAAAAVKLFHQAYQSAKSMSGCEWELRRKDGSILIVEGSIQLIHDINGKPIGFRGLQRNVTARRQAEQALRESEAKYRGILETIEDAYYEVDLDGTMHLANRALARLLGARVEDIIGRCYFEFQSPAAALQISTLFAQVLRTGVPAHGVDWHIHRKDGSRVIAECSIQITKNAQDIPIGFRGMLRDVTERRRFEKALRESEARFRALTKLSSDWYWEQDSEFRYTRMESRHSSKSSAQYLFLGKRPWETPLQMSGGWDEHMALLREHKPFRDLIMYRMLHDGRPYYISVSGEPFFSISGRFAGYRGVSREITHQKLAEERVQHLATHDVLTGLPNRAHFSQLLAQTILNAQQTRDYFALLFVDLDRFKFVNDTMGHDAGDQLLKELTARFRRSLRTDDVVARFGGDEFIVLLRGVDTSERIAKIARKLLATATLPIQIEAREIRITASIGIACFPTDGDDERTLLKSADIAMYSAKEDGKNTFHFYSRELKARALEKLSIEHQLRNACLSEEFTLHFQPKRNLKHGHISGAEALLRWNNAELGSVAPERFVALAEETGLIIDIGKWVLRQACAQCVSWLRSGLPEVAIAVNLSARQFADKLLVDDIAATLTETGMPPHLLELEVTEGMMIHNPALAAQILERIKKLGVRLAVDDFGTGYSSLGQLKNYPIDTLKIDQSFIRDIHQSDRNRALTEAIIAMGKSLGLNVVAEGVETQEQEDFLRHRGCDEIQGYLFAHPLPADEFARMLKAHSGQPLH